MSKQQDVAIALKMKVDGKAQAATKSMDKFANRDFAQASVSTMLQNAQTAFGTLDKTLAGLTAA